MTFQLVKPAELEKQVLVESNEKLVELLEKIDMSLRTSAKIGGINNIGTSVDVRGFNKFVIDRAIEECRRSGWDAKYTYDQRDGDYLQIKKRPTRSAEYER